MEIAVQILITILGSGALFSFIQFLLQRKDSREDRLKELEDSIKEGLERREEISTSRYETHEEAIQELNKAILQSIEDGREIKKEIGILEDALRGLAHDRIIHLTDRYQDRGAVTLKEKANLDAIYKPYHEGLKGNGDGQMGYEYVMKLPVISDEEAREKDIAILRKNNGH